MPGPERRLAAILSADIAGYSRLMAEDEDATIRTLHTYQEEIELLLRQHCGRLVRVHFTDVAEVRAVVGVADPDTGRVDGACHSIREVVLEVGDEGFPALHQLR